MLLLGIVLHFGCKSVKEDKSFNTLSIENNCSYKIVNEGNKDIDSILFDLSILDNFVFSFENLEVKKIQFEGLKRRVFLVKRNSKIYTVIDFYIDEYSEKVSEDKFDCTISDINIILDDFPDVQKIQFLSMLFSYSKEKFLAKWSTGDERRIQFEGHLLTFPNKLVEVNPYILRKAYRGYDLFGIEGEKLKRYFIEI